MKAFVKLSDSSSNFTLHEMPRPEAGDTQLLVSVQAVGVGIHDGYFFPQSINYPYVIGIEAAGTIEHVGESVSAFSPGERIAFVSAMHPKGGTWAEYAVVDQDALIVRIPNSMTFEEAASLPVAGNTAIKAFRCLSLTAGDNLFIAGGSGAIGTLAIQVAKDLGYHAIASASTMNQEYMRSLGADIVVDYQRDDWESQVLSRLPQGVDAAIAIPPGTAKQSEGIVKSGGVIVTVSGDQFLTDRGIELKQIPYDADVMGDLEKMFHKVSTGTMHLTIEQIYPFAEGLDALAKTQTRHARGKRVLTMRETKGVDDPV